MRTRHWIFAGLALSLGAACSTQAETASANGDMSAPGMRGMTQAGPLAALDTDGDGTASFEEIRLQRAAQFSELDQNSDGFLNQQEASSGLSAFGRGGGGGRGAGYAFLAADADFDGALTQAEFVEAVIPMLARIDTNMDSRLTRDELAAAREQLQARRAAMSEN